MDPLIGLQGDCVFGVSHFLDLVMKKFETQLGLMNGSLEQKGL